MTTMRADAIVVEGRHRVDLGDVDSLAESIRSVGLLHPIVVTRDSRLVAGARRLEACRRLGWDDVPVTIADSWESAASALIAERDENTCRKAMTPSELAALGAALETVYKPQARERMSKGGKGGSPEPPSRVREQVGEAIGVSGATYQRIQTVARDSENTELPEDRRQAAQEALDAMDAGAPIRQTYQDYRDEHTNGAPKTLENGRDAMRANAHKRRTIELISGINGLARGIPTIDLERVRLVTDDRELAGLTNQLSAALTTLRQFRAALQKGESLNGNGE